MNNLWGTLIPLAVASAVVPVQIVITLTLLRAPAGRAAAVGWVGGMTAVRVAQGVVFGLLLGADRLASSDGGGPGPFASVLLLVMAILFYVTAFRQMATDEDPDAPPPRWMARMDAMTPGGAFLLGAGYLVIAVKFWVFTLGAIAAIDDADLGLTAAIGTFLLFVVLAESVHLVAVGASFASPERSAAVFGRAVSWLERRNRVIIIALGLGFGTWFLLKALDGLGVT